MNNEPDMIDAIEWLRIKLNQEYNPAFETGVNAYEHKMLMEAARRAVAKAEEGRLEFYEDLLKSRPELPSPPVALQSAPAQTWNDDDLYEMTMPNVVRGMGR